MVRRRVLERGLRAPRRRSAASRRPPRRAARARLGQQHLRQHDRRRGLSGVTATVRTCSSGVFETSWIESTAPSDETQSRGSRRSRSALRAYSIDEIGATSSSPASSCAVELGRDALHLLDLGVEAEEDRRHVHVGDAAEPDVISSARSTHCVGERVELLAVRCRRGRRGRAPRSRARPRASARARRSRRRGRARRRAARRRARAHELVLPRGEEQRQRRRPLAQVGAGDLAGLDRLARAVEDVVGDLEGDPEVSAERAERLAARRAGTPPRTASPSSARSARGRRRRSCPGRASAAAASPRRGRGTSAASARICTARAVAGRGELGERAREEIVAGRARGVGAVRRPGRGAAAPSSAPVDQVVVHERRHVHELDRDAGRERRLVASARGEEDEQRAQALAAGGERLAGRPRRRARDARRPRARAAPRARRGTASRPGVVADLVAQRSLRATPCAARRSPPAKQPVPHVVEAGSRSSAASSSGPGKRRTLAGRYVYAAPPGSTLPSSGTMRSNQSE